MARTTWPMLPRVGMHSMQTMNLHVWCQSNLQILRTLSLLTSSYFFLMSWFHSLLAAFLYRCPTPNNNFSLRASIDINILQDHGNSYKEKHLPGTGLKFHRFSPFLSWQCAATYGVGERAEKYIYFSSCSWSRLCVTLGITCTTTAQSFTVFLLQEKSTPATILL